MYQIVKSTLTNEVTCIARMEDYAYIPLDEANSDYQQYLAWVDQGNVAEEWNPNGD